MLDLKDTEDQHLLHSLAASVCPELGNNFVLFDKKLRVDTMPAFKKLQQAQAQQGWVCRLSVVPTFVLNDTIGLELSGAEEKKQPEGVAPAAPLEFAAGWLECSSDKAKAKDNKTRWQYIDNDGAWKDCDAKINASLQRNFAKGLKMCSFHRRGTQYQVDLVAMTLKNLSNHRTRPMRRVDVNAPYAPSAHVSYVAPVKSGTFQKW